MAFAGFVCEDMVEKSIVYIIFMHLMLMKNVNGYLKCSNETVSCSNGTYCAEFDQVCTQYNDCIDSHGEQICKVRRSNVTNSIACLINDPSNLIFEWLSPNQICDGHQDCKDNSDEKDCGKYRCPIGQWLCRNEKCIDMKYVCDKTAQCADGSDEGSFCRNNLCETNHMHCPTGECISNLKKCDGIPHCSDGFDEKDCPRRISTTIQDSCSIQTNAYMCSGDDHLICISNDRVCDGYFDCPMHDDELECSTKCASNTICSTDANVQCIQHQKFDQICQCKKSGYKLTANTHQCQDFDECHDSLDNICSFKCSNIDGSFNCSCPYGYKVERNSKTCRQVNGLGQPNLLILTEHNMQLFNLEDSQSYHHSLIAFKTVNMNSNEQIEHINYDPFQKFIIYSDPKQKNIYCKSILTSTTRLLIQNLSIQAFTYNFMEKNLFLIDSLSQTLRLYTSINCDSPVDIQMHMWTFNDTYDRIHSMDIDIESRQLIFASRYKFFRSNFSQPNQINIVYSTDQDIKRFIYESTFKRLFWTTNYQLNSSSYPVHTCNQQFTNCRDTNARLPFAWPFAFFNDGILYNALSSQSLELIQIYGDNRFLKVFISSTKEKIRSFLTILNPQIKSANLCLEKLAQEQCKDRICLQINSTNFNCISIDETLRATQFPISMNSIDDAQSSINNDVSSNTINQKTNYYYRPKNTILFFIIAIALIALIWAIIYKRWYKLIFRKPFDGEHRPNEHSLVADEPTLDEFNVIYDTNDRLPLTNQLAY